MSEWTQQQARNKALIDASRYMRERVESKPLDFSIDIKKTAALSSQEIATLQALEIDAARIALSTLASLAQINELDHLGGALDLIPALAMTMALADNEKVTYTFEHAHTSVGHYAALAAWEYIDRDWVIDTFRRGLDIAGHVSWLPGGTQLNGGRLGVMVPAAVGQALGLKAHHGEDAWVICHCGDAGWISGQALNGFNAADLHGAPTTFIMHRNGIQLSNTNKKIMDKDPRPIIASMGIEIIEIPSLLDTEALYQAYRKGRELARQGRPNLIYPVGYPNVTLTDFGEQYGVLNELQSFAAQNGVAMDTPVWIPGSLMSYRDLTPMFECLFHVNDLPGGAGHHDGHMKGRSLDDVLANPLLRWSPEQESALADLRARDRISVLTEARPKPGSPNLEVSDAAAGAVDLPPAGKAASPRAGVEKGYALIAEQHPDKMFNVSCDLDPSTKLGKAAALLPAGHCFEMSIQEQVSAIMTNGLAVSGHGPQLNVFATFSAFFEGIAREGFEMWRYHRNLTGVNEGLNATFHLSHVGACTGRDHFSGWSLDWITLALGYLPYLHRFYAPADARAAFIAVRDLAANYGGHIIGIPRDNLPILAKQDGSGPLWEASDRWEPVTKYRTFDGAKKAILALGAPAWLAGEAADELQDVDVHIINGFPLPDAVLPSLFDQYPDGIVTVEDGLIATPATGLRGFAGMVCSAAQGRSISLQHLGIVDPSVAPSEGHLETWEHFGITKEALLNAARTL